MRGKTSFFFLVSCRSLQISNFIPQKSVYGIFNLNHELCTPSSLSITTAIWASILNFLAGRDHLKNFKSNAPMIKY